MIWDTNKMPKIGAHTATSHPSYPSAFKSSFYIEDEHESAHIKVDFDTHKNPIKIDTVVRALSNATHFRHAITREKTPLFVREVLVFTTGRGHHIRLWFDVPVQRVTLPLPPLPINVSVPLSTSTHNVIPAATILRIQAACGDDAKRQRFNAARVKRGEAGWNVLWRSKWKNGALLSKEVIDVERTRELRNKLARVTDAAKARWAKRKVKS